MRLALVRFLEEIEDTKKKFRNKPLVVTYLTCRTIFTLYHPIFGAFFWILLPTLKSEVIYGHSFGGVLLHLVA